MTAVSSLLATAALLAVTAPAQAATPEHPFLEDLSQSVVYPCGAATDSEGDLYVADYESEAVTIYDPSGALITEFETSEPPCALAVDTAGNVYVNGFESAVVKYKPQNETTEAHEYPPTAETEYVADSSLNGTGVLVAFATSVAVDPATQNVYVAQGDHISSYQPDGTLISATIGSGVSGALYYGVDVYGENGNVYVTDEGNDRVYVLNPAGSQVLVEIDGSDTAAGSFSMVYGYLAVDQSNGHVYVTDIREHGVVDEFDAAGELVSEIAHSFESSDPSDIAVDNSGGPNQGNVYVTSFDGNVYAFGPLNYGARKFEFKVLKNGSGSGGVACEVEGGSAEPCPETATEYLEGTEIVLTATADPGYTFAGFSGGGCSASPCTLTLAADTTVTATFNQPPPTVENNPPGTVTQTSAVLNGHVDNNGDPAGSTCKFVVALEEPPHTVVAEPACNTNPVTGSANTAVTATVGNLNAATKYVYRVVATNSGGTSTGEPDVAFTTLVGPPRIFAQSASPLGTTAAVLAGYVNPSGLTTSYHFEYDTTPYEAGGPPHGTEVPLGGEEIGDGTVAVSVSRQIEELSPDTAYHFRLVATNSAGTTNGHDTTFTTARAESSCPNAAIRAEQGPEVLALPDCMALEQVSPPVKGNQFARVSGGGAAGVFSASGDRILFNSIATLGECENVNALGGDPFLASRGAGGWETDCVNLPFSTREEIGADLNSRIFGFSPDLSSWFQWGVRYSDGKFQYFRMEIGGKATPLTPPFEDISVSGTARPVAQGNSADLSKLYFKPEEPRSNRYLPGDPLPAGAGEDSNLYIAERAANGNPTLTLLARDRDGKTWGGNCGARLGGMESSSGANLNVPNGDRNQGAISPDGSRVYFSTRPNQPETGNCTEANKKRIMERLETPTGPEIKELIASECDRVSPPCATHDGDDIYQGASLDQTKVYFTTNRQLADTDLDGSGTSCIGNDPIPGGFFAVPGCDLYLYDRTQPVGQRLIQVSAGDDTAPTPGEGANVPSAIAGISADGSHVYFVAAGILTADPSPAGDVAVEGQPNFYVWSAQSREIAFIGALAGNDGGFVGTGLWGSSGGTWSNAAYPVPIKGTDSAGNEVGGDGHVLVFNSRAPVTADDTDGSVSDVFRYDAEADTLERISKGRPGGADNGPFAASAVFGAGIGSDYSQKGRPVSEDGETIAFRSQEALLPGDLNGAADVYLRRDSGLYRLPGSTEAPTSPQTPLVSADGSVAYNSIQQLTASDRDSTLDVYVARPGGGFRTPVESVCEGEACQGAPATVSGEIGAATAAFQGPGNQSSGSRSACARLLRAARKQRRAAAGFGRRARRLARAARRSPGPGRAKALRHRAHRLAAAAHKRRLRAKRLSDRAKLCRRANRRASR